jgi:hypothetical protein
VRLVRPSIEEDVLDILVRAKAAVFTETYIDYHQKDRGQHSSLVHPSRNELVSNSCQCLAFMVKRPVTHARLKILARGPETQAESYGGFKQLDILQSRGEDVSNKWIVFSLVFQSGSLRRSPCMNVWAT